MNITRTLFVAAVVFLPNPGQAQATAKSQPPHGLTIMGGAFADERGEGGHHPYISARYERWLSRFVAFEGGITHAKSERLWMSQVTFETRPAAASFSSGDIGLQLQLPLGQIRPYMGATIGGTHFRNSSNGDREVGLTHALLAGARVGRFRAVSLRGEFRLRRDDVARTVSYNGEYGLGLTYNF